MSQVTGLVILPQMNAAWVDWPKRLRTQDKGGSGSTYFQRSWPKRARPPFKKACPKKASKPHRKNKRQNKAASKLTMENSGEQAHHKNTRQNIKAASKLTMKKRRASSPSKEGQWKGEQAHHSQVSSLESWYLGPGPLQAMKKEHRVCQMSSRRLFLTLLILRALTPSCRFGVQAV